jgi:hypothetical protein
MVLLAAGGASGSCTHDAKSPSAAMRIVVTFGPSLEPKPLDGRLLVILAKEESPEPRFRVTDNDDTA